MGVFVIGQCVSLGPIVQDILLIAGASLDGESEAQVSYLPVKPHGPHRGLMRSSWRLPQCILSDTLR